MDNYQNPNDFVKDRRSTDPSLMTYLDIQEMTGVSKHTVTKWAQTGVLPKPKFRIPRFNQPVYDKQDVIDALVEHGRLVRTA